MALRKITILIATCCLIFLPTQAQILTVESQMSNMSLEQKVGQLFVMSFFGSELNFAAQDFITTWQPGAVVFLPSNVENPAQITRLTNSIQENLLNSGSIPALIAVDQEGGIIAHLEEGFTTWAVPSLLTATQNPDLAYDFGAALAEEMLAVGINMNLAPVADLQTNRANPIIGRRSFGNDPQQVASIVASVVEGMQDNGVLATVKHFPGHGDTDNDSHLGLPILTYNQDELMTRELIPFQAVIDVNTSAIMVAHIHFPEFDALSTPASLSENIITDLLREEMGYDGLVITDALDMDAIDTVYSPSSAALNALNAGNDLILLGAHISPENQAIAIQSVIDAVQSGEIPESRIDESVYRILRAKEQFGLLDWAPLDPNTAEQRINQEAHASLVDEMFVQGITVVYDEQNLLPATGRTLMIYPNTRAHLGLACNSPDWRFLQVPLVPSDADIQQASQASTVMDTIIVFTENVENNPQQASLIEALPLERTIVVALWSPFDALFLPELSTYLVTYSPLSQSYDPLCAILHGEAEAQGTLSVLLEP